MYDVISGIAALALIYLGFRLVKRFREMAGWSDNDPIVDGNVKTALPPDLRELEIEEPPETIVDDAGSQKGREHSRRLTALQSNHVRERYTAHSIRRL